MAYAADVKSLRNLQPTDHFAILGGANSPGDGGGGLWYWDPVAPEPDDFGTTVKVIGTPAGRWKRFIEDHVNVRWFGATGIGETDDHDPIQAAIDFVAKSGDGKCRVLIPPGRYRILKPLLIPETAWGLILEGNATQVADKGQNVIIECAFPKGIAKHGAQIAMTGAMTPNAYGVQVPSATVTNLVGMVLSDVGSWLFFDKSSLPGAPNNGAFQILDFANSSEVTIAAEGGAAETGLDWVLANEPALRIMSRECVVRGLVFMPATNHTIFCGISDMKGNATIQTANVFERVRVSNDGSAGRRFIFGFVHGDNPDQTGWPQSDPATPTPVWSTNGENNAYFQCYALNAALAGYWCPNRSGQNKKIVFDQCHFGLSPYGIWQQSGGIVVRACDLATCSRAAVMIQNGWCDQLVIQDCQSEGCARLLDCRGVISGAQNAQIIGGRYDPSKVHPDGHFVRFRGGGTLTIQGAMFDNTWRANVKILVSNPYDSLATGIRRAQVVAIASTFPNDAPFVHDVNCGHVRTVLGCNHPRVNNLGGADPLPNEVGAYVP